MIKKISITLAGLALVAGIALSQDKKEPLQPQMQPIGGWEKQGEMGKKGDAAWTETSVAAGVNKKPLDGKTVTVEGEIIDISCYLQLGKHGQPHEGCGKKCITNGQPIGMVTKTGTIYLLMEEEHDPRRDGLTSFRKAAAENFAKVLTVTGTETKVNGINAVYVQGFVSK